MKREKDQAEMDYSNHRNPVQKAREDKMMSKAELAKKAGLTVQTIDRIERGYHCRLATKRKIILALGYQLSDREKIFINTDAPKAEHREETESDAESQKERVRILRKKTSHSV